jgi:carbamoyl-phosphate synthase large subunit
VLSSKGKGLAAVVVREPRLEAMARRIVEHLRWRGPFELEFMHDESHDSFHVIEMNPRFPAWADFPSALGLNLPAQVIAVLTSQQMEPTASVPPGRFFIRHQVELIGSIDEIGSLATQGEWQAPRSRT